MALTANPWRTLTASLHCPTCGARPGDDCTANDGSLRVRYHWPRYATARILAGDPLTREVPRRYRLDPPRT